MTFISIRTLGFGHFLSILLSLAKYYSDNFFVLNRQKRGQNKWHNNSTFCMYTLEYRIIVPLSIVCVMSEVLLPVLMTILYIFL